MVGAIAGSQLQLGRNQDKKENRNFKSVADQRPRRKSAPDIESKNCDRYQQRHTMSFIRKTSNRIKETLLGQKREKKNILQPLFIPEEVVKLGKLAKARMKLERARDEFSKELNKSLNDESRLDDLLDEIIFAEQEVLHHERDEIRRSLQSDLKNLNPPRKNGKSQVRKTQSIATPISTPSSITKDEVRVNHHSVASYDGSST